MCPARQLPAALLQGVVGRQALGGAVGGTVCSASGLAVERVGGGGQGCIHRRVGGAAAVAAGGTVGSGIDGGAVHTAAAGQRAIELLGQRGRGGLEVAAQVAQVGGGVSAGLRGVGAGWWGCPRVRQQTKWSEIGEQATLVVHLQQGWGAHCADGKVLQCGAVRAEQEQRRSTAGAQQGQSRGTACACLQRDVEQQLLRAHGHSLHH